MAKSSGAAQNDKAIYGSITSLMKAQAYELGAIPRRKASPTVYQFNLLSIADTEIVRLMFSSKDIVPSFIEHEHHVARYIINGKETVSRIRFVRAGSFKSVLPEYDALHRANCRWFDAQCSEFYHEIVSDPNRYSVLKEQFRKAIKNIIFIVLDRARLEKPEAEAIGLYWSEFEGRLKVLAAQSQAGVAALNAKVEVRNKIAGALKDLYRYTGDFDIEEVIPF
jgi:hypothetical protein